ncbi:hypothetical protein L0F63_006813 [Massospora cicadina]|nr:hypothetical protein L0F63_006813 [Massospora cicadina]
MYKNLSRVYIVAAKRTPFGAFMGKLKGMSATELGGLASQAAIGDLPGEVKVDSVIFGNVCQTSNDAAYLARHVGHRAGVPIATPALTVNRLCGSGFQSVINAVHEIRLGESQVVLAGGAESMSQAPHVLRGARDGAKFGTDLKLEDSLAAALIDRYPVPTPMGITAENLGEKYGISREDCDRLALCSQHRYAKAQAAKVFDAEILPVEVKVRRKVERVGADEHPRPETTMEGLSKLPPVFIKDTGLVTAGNASGIADGAAAVVVAGQEAVAKYRLKPLAEIVGYQVVGVAPEIMGIGPAPAIRGALARAGLSLGEMGQIEVNEAFAAQYLAVERELGLDRNVTNPHGGAIALGHPLGASGARILGHLAHQMAARGLAYTLGSACIGGGQGIAIVLKNVGDRF